jgi:hypothetical protein
MIVLYLDEIILFHFYVNFVQYKRPALLCNSYLKLASLCVDAAWIIQIKKFVGTT